MSLRSVLALTLGFTLLACGGDDDDDAAGDDDSSEAGDDDDSSGAGDDDDAATGEAPVLAGLSVTHAMAGDECRAYVTFTGTDADGDIATSSVFVGFNPAPPLSWTFDTGSAPPMYEVAYAVDILISDGAVVPHVKAEEVYDVEVWVFDDAVNESNHLMQAKWQAPTQECELP
jgi:hypothetical protein